MEIQSSNQDTEGLTWVRARGADPERCLEMAKLPDGGALIRHSAHPGVMIRYSAAEMQAFMGGVELGEFDDFGQGDT